MKKVTEKLVKATWEFGDIKAKCNGKTYNTNDRVSYQEMFFQYRNGKEIVNFEIYQKRRNGEFFMVIADAGGDDPKFYILPIPSLVRDALVVEILSYKQNNKPYNKIIGNHLYECTKELIKAA